MRTRTTAAEREEQKTHTYRAYEINYLLDVDVIGEEHAHAVHAHAPTSSGWQPVLERRAEGFVENLSLIIALMTTAVR